MAAKEASSALSLDFFFSFDLCSARSKENLRRGEKERSMFYAPLRGIVIGGCGEPRGAPRARSSA
eukprot:CAMPEP_0119281422 /NCGR_PEP_ID=MMETSP1329-20130426/24680_1 /TAXON_ID=114041 /ORGANISM="Genus nov. species nov., Strain RCC1024" /LENGTH=64 /DNA_ID=CAMNT_0007282041 /DNA_START=23 /DNA_END=213 /DNA_ORIENTATION=+